MDLRTIIRLLPTGWLWQLAPGSVHRRFWERLAEAEAEARTWIAEVGADAWATWTRRVAEAEVELGLMPVAQLSDEERRARLVGAAGDWGGLGLDEVEEAVRALGFDVRLYQWWDEAKAPRDLEALLGENARVLRNRVRNIIDQLFADGIGSDTMVCGGEDASCGHFVGSAPTEESPTLADAKVGDAWPYVVTVAGETIEDRALVPAYRRDELEYYLLGRLPAEQWIAMHVEYT